MTVFEYISVLMAIVLGLAVSRAMIGVARFINKDQRATKDWIAAGWCLNVAFLSIIWWLSGWTLFSDLHEIPLGVILYWICTTALIAFCCYVLVPEIGAQQVRALGVAVRPAFFLCLSGHFAFAGINFVFQDSTPTWLLFLVVYLVLLTGAGMFLRNDRSHVILLLVWIASVVTASVTAIPAVGPSGSF